MTVKRGKANLERIPVGAGVLASTATPKRTVELLGRVWNKEQAFLTHLSCIFLCSSLLKAGQLLT